jgi:hypothetical protein
MNIIRLQFKDIYKKYDIQKVFSEIPNKEKYTSIEILKYIKMIQGDTISSDNDEKLNKIHDYLIIGDKKKLNNNIILINELYKTHNLKENMK